MKSLSIKTLLLLSTALNFQAYAACLPEATNGNDIVTCDSSTTGFFNGRLGNDIITVEEGTNMGGVYGSHPDSKSPDPPPFIAGNDKIIVQKAQSVRIIYGDLIDGKETKAGRDEIIVEDSTVVEVYGDYIFLSPFSTPASDIISIKNTKATMLAGELIYASDSTNTIGNDEITVDNSQVDYLYGDHITSPSAGNDRIQVINGSTVNKVIFGDSFFSVAAEGDIKAGNDTIIVRNSTILGNERGIAIAGENLVRGVANQKYIAGNDNITIENSLIKQSIYSDDVDASDPNGDRVFGNDTLNLNNATIEGNIYLSGGNDTITLKGVNKVGKIFGGDANGENEEGYIDTLNISGYKGTLQNIGLPPMEGFEDFGIIGGSAIDLGDSYTSPASYLNLRLDKTSRLLMTGGGSGNYTIGGNFYNQGALHFIDGKVGDKLIIGGNYIESAGAGGLYFDVDLSTLTSDGLIVKGNMQTSRTSLQLADHLSGSSNFGDISLISAPNDTNRLDENFVFHPISQYNHNPRAARLKNSPYIWYLKPSGNSWLISSFEEETSGGGGSEGGGSTGGGGSSGGGGSTGGGGSEGGGNTGGGGSSGGGGSTGGGSTGGNSGGSSGGGSSGGGGSGGNGNKLPVIAEIPAYSSLPAIGRTIIINELDGVHSRLGELRNNKAWIGSGPSNLKSNLGSGWHNQTYFDDSRLNGWLKGSWHHLDYGAATGFAASGSYGGLSLGVDKKFTINNQWNNYLGVFSSYSRGNFKTSGEGAFYYSRESADIHTKSRSFGAYASFYNQAGSYFDILGEYVMLKADIKAAGLNAEAKGHALAGSIEAGHRFDIQKDFIIEPQIQLKGAKVDWDDTFDPVRTVSFDDNVYIVARGGLRLEKVFTMGNKEIRPWIYAGIKKELSGGAEITVAGLELEDHATGLAGKAVSGITIEAGKNLQLYGDIGYEGDFENYTTISGNVGLRLWW